VNEDEKADEKVDEKVEVQEAEVRAEEEQVEDQRAPYMHDPEVHGRDYRVEGNDVRDYVGVSPEYKTYANEYDKPILTDTERFQFTDQYDHLEGNADEEVIETDREVSTGDVSPVAETDEIDGARKADEPAPVREQKNFDDGAPSFL
jgi:hypothetical protein